MIIGDTMGDRVSLMDMNFKNMPVEQKRAALVIMDLMLKKLHAKNMMVTDFNIHNIYFQDGIYFFSKTAPISSIVADNKEMAILNNMIWMSMVALWAYSDHSSNSLLAPLYVSNHFANFSFWYPEEDRAYYKSILVDSYQAGKVVGTDIYLSDHVIKQSKGHSSTNASSLAYVKATEAGRALASMDEAAFGHNFFLLTVAASLVVIMLGVLFYFSNYLV